ncbi:MAG: hypothetical protein IKK98_03950 [Oscillospiraceae bacterium]|nr:hypothetical protein [Oscillospiraceae bacterium]
MNKLEAVKSLLEQSGLLPQEVQSVMIDHLTENRPCAGLFPQGSQMISQSAGSWQQDFLLQLSLYALDDVSRRRNQQLLDALCRWAQKLDLSQTECTGGVSLHLEKGRLLYPATDGRTFIYQLEGSFCWEEEEDGGESPLEKGWWLRFSQKENWTKLKNIRSVEKKALPPKRWLCDKKGNKVFAAEDGEKTVFFTLERSGNETVLEKVFGKEGGLVFWLCCSGEEGPKNGKSGTGLLSAEETDGEKGTVRLQLSTGKERSCFVWADESGSVGIWKE